MQRKNEGVKPLGICRRLFNFVMESLPFHTFKQVTVGRLPSAKTSQHDHDTFTGEGSGFDPYVVEEEDEVALLPPIRAIPVEHQEKKKWSFPIANVEGKLDDPRRTMKQKTDKAKKKNKHEGNDMFKGRSSIEKEDKKSKTVMSLGRTQASGKNEGAVVPVTPVPRSPSYIDKRSEEFIKGIHQKRLSQTD